MALFVYGFEATVFDVSVDLRRPDARMSEHLLQSSDVRPTCQQVRGETVP
jgi:hypothetical protein